MYFLCITIQKFGVSKTFFFIQQEWVKLVKSDSKNLDIVKKIAVLLNFCWSKTLMLIKQHNRFQHF